MFLDKVVKGRNMSLVEVEKIAQGRVWTGRSAHELGLIDNLGNLDDAVGSAAKLAGLSDFGVIHLDKPLTAREKLIRSLNRLIKSRMNSAAFLAGNDGLTLLQEIWADLTPLQQLNDPKGVYAYCLTCRSD